MSIVLGKRCLKASFDLELRLPSTTDHFPSLSHPGVGSAPVCAPWGRKDRETIARIARYRGKLASGLPKPGHGSAASAPKMASPPTTGAISSTVGRAKCKRAPATSAMQASPAPPPPAQGAGTRTSPRGAAKAEDDPHSCVKILQLHVGTIQLDNQLIQGTFPVVIGRRETRRGASGWAPWRRDSSMSKPGSKTLGVSAAASTKRRDWG